MHFFEGVLRLTGLLGGAEFDLPTRPETVSDEAPASQPLFARDLAEAPEDIDISSAHITSIIDAR